MLMTQVAKNQKSSRELHVYKSADKVIKEIADYFVRTVSETILRKRKCNVVLSGGHSPKPLYKLLASPHYSRQIEWDKVYFFFADERCVPFTGSDNNGWMVKKTLFEPLRTAEENIFYVNMSLSPEESANEYAGRIISHFENDPICFDFILLGLGEDAHTASLFPHAPVLKEKKALVKAVYLRDKPAYRITMTAKLINRSSNIAFLVYGESKAEAVKETLEGEKDFETYPAQLICPKEGNIHWYMDILAASSLKAVHLTI